jgi:hypothetical protein
MGKESSLAELLFDSLGGKLLMILLVIFGLAILIPGFIILWAYKLMLAVVFFILAIIGLFALHRVEALDVEKYPWLALLPFVCLFAGFFAERLELLSVQPLSVSGYASGLNLPIVLAVVLGVLLVAGLASRKS